MAVDPSQMPPAPAQVPPGVPADPKAARDAAQYEALLNQIMGAELPGEGYAFADLPEERQKQLVKTTPTFVRENLLRAVEVMTFDLQLPLSEDKKADVGHALLAAAQAYLLLDPTLDTEGIPVEGPGSKPHASAAAAHQFPPRVAPNSGEAAIAEKNKPKSEALKKTRPDQPRPQPRVGS